jgi:hypothetical protein
MLIRIENSNRGVAATSCAFLWFVCSLAGGIEGDPGAGIGSEASGCVVTLAPPGGWCSETATLALPLERIPPGADVELVGVVGDAIQVRVQDCIRYMRFEYFEGVAAADSFMAFAMAFRDSVRRAELSLKDASLAAEKAEVEAAAIRAYRQRLEYLVARFGEVIGLRIYEGQFWIGMTDIMAGEALGSPDRVNRTVTERSVSEQWVYRRAGLYLYFEDGVLRSWQD